MRIVGNDSRIELRVQAPLKDWIVQYAKERNTTVSAIVVRFLIRLMEEESKKSKDAEQI